jgi:hypothetical protein
MANFMLLPDGSYWPNVSGASGTSSTYSNVNGDFTATANAGAKTITISAVLSTTLLASLTHVHWACARIVRIPAAGGTVDQIPTTNAVWATPTVTLSDMAANFTAGDLVAVFLPGPEKGPQYHLTRTTRTDGQYGPLEGDNQGNLATVDKSRDETSGSQKTSRVDPEWLQYLAETLVDTTNVATGTYYPSSSGMAMDGYRDLSFDGYLTDGVGETTTLTLETSNFGGTTAADWEAVYFWDGITNAWVNSISATNTTTKFRGFADKFNVGYYRFKIVTSASTNTVKVVQRRVY